MRHPASFEPHYASHADGSIVQKTYKIPFRPEYLLIDATPDAPCGLSGLVSAAQPSGRDIRAWRFHLSPEAIELIRAQDPNVRDSDGYASLTIKFDAEDTEHTKREVTRPVRVSELTQPS